MRRLLTMLACLGLVATGSACRDSSETPADAAASTGVVPSPTPTRSMFEWNDLVAGAELSIIEVGASDEPKTEKFEAVFVLPCGIEPSAKQQAARGWSYVAEDRTLIGYGVGA